jgi:hypothetical protein
MVARIKDAYATDVKFNAVIGHLKAVHGDRDRLPKDCRNYYLDAQGLLFLQSGATRRLRIACQAERVRMMCEFHDAPAAGHLRVELTLARLQQVTCWPKMHATSRPTCSPARSVNATRPNASDHRV